MKTRTRKTESEVREVCAFRLTPMAQEVLAVECGKESGGRYIERLILENARSEKAKAIITKHLRLDSRFNALCNALGVQRPFNYPTHRLASAII